MWDVDRTCDGRVRNRARDFAAADDVRSMQSHPTDAELLAQSVNEPELFAGLYERHGLTVRRYIIRRIGNEAGDDLGSEVFIRAFRARGRYRAHHDAALPWLLGIANNVIADHRRLERRRLAALESLSHEATAPAEHRDAGLAPELVAALRRLPAIDRDTLLLVVWGELSQHEAAAAPLEFLSAPSAHE